MGTIAPPLCLFGITNGLRFQSQWFRFYHSYRCTAIRRIRYSIIRKLNRQDWTEMRCR
jgi:hypothetical protein